MKRTITKREEQAYRLAHSDFEGLSIDKTAKQMGITRKAVLRLLKNIERKAPQLSPVLTPRQRAILHLLEKDLTPMDIAEAMNLSNGYVYRIIGLLHRYKFIATPVKTIQYSPGMDNRIIHKF